MCYPSTRKVNVVTCRHLIRQTSRSISEATTYQGHGRHHEKKALKSREEPEENRLCIPGELLLELLRIHIEIFNEQQVFIWDFAALEAVF